VAAQFSPDEVGALLSVIALRSLIVPINAWTMVGVASRAWEPGSCQP
jgi:hypothetical protein